MNDLLLHDWLSNFGEEYPSFFAGARGDNSPNSEGTSTPSSKFPAWRFPGQVICQSLSIDAMFHDPVTDLTTVFKGMSP